MSQVAPLHDPTDYPFAIQRVGAVAMRVYDRLEASLLADGYTAEEADMLMAINLPDVLAEVHYDIATRHAALRARLDDLTH